MELNWIYNSKVFTEDKAVNATGTEVTDCTEFVNVCVLFIVLIYFFLLRFSFKFNPISIISLRIT